MRREEERRIKRRMEVVKIKHNRVKERKEETGTMRGGVNFDYGDPLGCSKKEEKRRGKKSTRGRNLSDLSLTFPFTVKLVSQQSKGTASQ